MKLSITTFQIICSCFNYPEQVLKDKEYLQKTIDYININGYLNYTKQEQQTAKKEINQLIKTL